MILNFIERLFIDGIKKLLLGFAYKTIFLGELVWIGWWMSEVGDGVNGDRFGCTC
jgi:hypothetical protein